MFYFTIKSKLSKLGHAARRLRKRGMKAWKCGRQLAWLTARGERQSYMILGPLPAYIAGFVASPAPSKPAIWVRPVALGAFGCYCACATVTSIVCARTTAPPPPSAVPFATTFAPIGGRPFRVEGGGGAPTNVSCRRKHCRSTNTEHSITHGGASRCFGAPTRNE